MNTNDTVSGNNLILHIYDVSTEELLYNFKAWTAIPISLDTPTTFIEDYADTRSSCANDVFRSVYYINPMYWLEGSSAPTKVNYVRPSRAISTNDGRGSLCYSYNYGGYKYSTVSYPPCDPCNCYGFWASTGGAGGSDGLPYLMENRYFSPTTQSIYMDPYGLLQYSIRVVNNVLYGVNSLNLHALTQAFLVNKMTPPGYVWDSLCQHKVIQASTTAQDCANACLRTDYCTTFYFTQSTATCVIMLNCYFDPTASSSGTNNGQSTFKSSDTQTYYLGVSDLQLNALPSFPSSPVIALTQTGPRKIPVPKNLALTVLGSEAFALETIVGYSAHAVSHLNDGVYGNSNSWIGGSANSFAGIKFSQLTVITDIAFSRDNTGTYSDRTLGQYTVECTKMASPDVMSTGYDWHLIGVLNYNHTSPVSPGLRHRFNFNSQSIGCTAIRIKTPDGACIDEIEIYGSGVTTISNPTVVSEGNVDGDVNAADTSPSPFPLIPVVAGAVGTLVVAVAAVVGTVIFMRRKRAKRTTITSKV